jgi:hypothetical protein
MDVPLPSHACSSGAAAQFTVRGSGGFQPALSSNPVTPAGMRSSQNQVRVPSSFSRESGALRLIYGVRNPACGGSVTCVDAYSVASLYECMAATAAASSRTTGHLL